ncbi:DUF4097 family beta strand repeat-containing protein [Streptomyces sp. NPDC050485]|uniref:DUF4097 family beta strand repeat-containing protein n=1 Tax=Streptomyces sp. NPDC050485 TaxID=3365617 RepID=UPI00379CF98E
MTATEQRTEPRGTERPRHRTAWIVTALLAALFIVAPFAFLTVADAVSETAAYASPGNGQRHPVSAVEVDAGAAQVTVTPGAAGEVRMTGRLNWSMKRPKVEEKWVGDTLKVHTHCDGFVDRYLQNCTVELNLTVPAGIRLKVRGGSGAIRVRDLTGPVDLAGGSGAIKLRGLKGTVKARVGSGELNATQLAGPEADLSAGSGTVNGEFTAPPRRVRASAGSGTVTVTVPGPDRYQVLGGRGSGDRSIQKDLVDENSDRILDVSSGSGSVTVQYPDGDPWAPGGAQAPASPGNAASGAPQPPGTP